MQHILGIVFHESSNTGLIMNETSTGDLQGFPKEVENSWQVACCEKFDNTDEDNTEESL